MTEPFRKSYLDEFARHKQPKKGKCKHSQFTNGMHRVGYVPLYSLLDGGLPGDSAKLICLDCSKMFSRSIFIPRNQPSKLGEKANVSN